MGVLPGGEKWMKRQKNAPYGLDGYLGALVVTTGLECYRVLRLFTRKQL